MRRLIVILGIPIDDLTMPEALDRLDEFIRTGRETGKVHQVATVNADFVVKALDDPELRGILQQADMATADGMPLVWGSRLLGVNLEGRVTGADMVPALAERASQRGYTMYLLGAAPGVAVRAAEILQAQYPALQIVGIVSPPYGSILEMDPAIEEGIRAAKPDILLVAFGNPKQEKWISMHSRTLQVPVMIGVGGTLDFIAGVTRRAPEWMQKSGLEWLFRLVQEPKRLWKRYVVDMGGFGVFFVRQWWAMRRSGPPSTLLPLSEPSIVEGVTILPVQGRLDRGNQGEFVRRADEALAGSPYLVIELSQAEFLDSSAFGALVGLTKRAREAGGEVWLAAVPEQVAKVIGLLRLDRYLEIRPDVATVLAERHGKPATRAAVPAPAATVAEPPASPAAAVLAPAAVAASEQRVVTIAMPRRLDASTAPEMQRECEAALGPGVRLILDFSQTTFLASAGMAVMVKLNRQAQAAGGDVRLACCSPDVVRTLQLTRLDAVLPIFADADAASK